MSPNTMLALAAAAFSLALALAGSCRKKRSLSTWCFAVGMLVFALENLFGAMWREAVVAEKAAFWGSLTLVMKSSIWYLNNNVLAGGGFGPTLPPGWGLVGVADFNRDGHADYALFNPITRQTAIWYLSGRTFLGGAFGPSVPNGWQLVATADFNGDNKPDYVLYNGGTRQTAIWYLNNNVYAGCAWGPTLPVGSSLVAP